MGGEEECYQDDSGKVCEGVGRREGNLFFVTPWNSIGYQNTVDFAQKMDFVAPVWFYIEMNKETMLYEFQGRQDIRTDYIDKIRNKNPNTKIVPRFYIPGDKNANKWALDPSNSKMILSELLQIAKLYNLDGYVFDIPLLNYVKYKGVVKSFLDSIQTLFKDYVKICTFQGNRFQHTKKISEAEPYLRVFDKILVCTYNFPTGYLAPKQWFIQNIQFYYQIAEKSGYSFGEKFMFGIQFYGYIEDLKLRTRREFKVDE